MLDHWLVTAASTKCRRIQLMLFISPSRLSGRFLFMRASSECSRARSPWKVRGKMPKYKIRPNFETAAIIRPMNVFTRVIVLMLVTSQCQADLCCLSAQATAHQFSTRLPLRIDSVTIVVGIDADCSKKVLHTETIVDAPREAFTSAVRAAAQKKATSSTNSCRIKCSDWVDRENIHDASGDFVFSTQKPLCR